jgi:GNAT superfamily N-acetyltransferase
VADRIGGALMAPDAVARAAAAALADDPFYVTVSGPSSVGPGQRALVLDRYFACSIAEGERLGRVDLHQQPVGVAVWIPPLDGSLELAAQQRKRAELAQCLGVDGLHLYDTIVAFMTGATAPWVAATAWYLSILAVDPVAQNAGIGRRLLAPALADADAAGVQCYLETFTPRSRSFYERLGFRTRAEIAEPTTGAVYAVMVREPRAPNAAAP